MILPVNNVQKDKFIILIQKYVKPVHLKFLISMVKYVQIVQITHNIIIRQNNATHAALEQFIILKAINVYVNHKHLI